MGVFIRPTKFLFDLMEIDDTNYRDIPFGLLNHTCAEEQIVFDLSMGNDKSELWNLLKTEKLLPLLSSIKKFKLHKIQELLLLEKNILKSIILNHKK